MTKSISNSSSINKPTLPSRSLFITSIWEGKKKLVYFIKALADYYNSASIKMITTFSYIKPTKSNYLITPISEDLTGTKSTIFK